MNHINRLLTVILFAALASAGCGISAASQRSETSISNTLSDGIHPDVEQKTVIKSNGSGINGGLGLPYGDLGANGVGSLGMMGYGNGGFGAMGAGNAFSVPVQVTTPIVDSAPVTVSYASNPGTASGAGDDRVAALETLVKKNERNIKRHQHVLDTMSPNATDKGGK